MTKTFTIPPNMAPHITAIHITDDAHELEALYNGRRCGLGIVICQNSNGDDDYYHVIADVTPEERPTDELQVH